MFRVMSLGARLPCSCSSGGPVKTACPSSSSIHYQAQYYRAWRTDLQRHSSGSTLAQRRSDLWKQKRVVVKLGSAVITREDECGLALGRLASIVEQVAVLQKQKKQIIIVTSGAVAFGKQLLRHESLLSMSLRQNLNALHSDQAPQHPEPRACAAVGQNGLMSMYDSMFQQYGFKTAQVLVNKKDFENELSRRNLSSTLSNLCALNTIPIINTNDAMAPPPEHDKDLAGVISIKDNDSLAAQVAVEMGAGLLILMTDVSGLYTAPPGSPDARLLSTYCPHSSSIIFGDKSRVGVGGMDSKVKAATWALENGTSVVICNGCEENAVLNIVRGQTVGTFFTVAPFPGVPIEVQARQARDGGLKVQTLTGQERSAIIHRLADLLLEHKESIISANHIDLAYARDAGMSQPVMASLELGGDKLEALSGKLRQLAAQFCQVQGQVLKSSKRGDGMQRRQITVPIGVLLVISETHADTLPQMAALSVCSGNGMLMKGGSEASHTNQVLHKLVQRALEPFAPPETVGLVSQHEDVADLLQLQQCINLVIPRGSPALMQQVQNSRGQIPVLGPSQDVCHVYLDEDAHPQMALHVVVDSKCQCPGASNTMETLLIHKKHRQGPLFNLICEQLKNNDVKFKPGPQLSKLLQFGHKPCASPKTEYGRLQCTVEVVDDVDEAIQHINTHGSGHTDTIVTSNDGIAKKFLQLVNSAHVFHNTSTRLSENLGIEVGIGTSSVQARGPVDIENLLTTKWVVQGRGHTMQDLVCGTLQLDLHTVSTQGITETQNTYTVSSEEMLSETEDTLSSEDMSETEDTLSSEDMSETEDTLLTAETSDSEDIKARSSTAIVN